MLSEAEEPFASAPGLAASLRGLPKEQILSDLLLRKDANIHQARSKPETATHCTGTAHAMTAPRHIHGTRHGTRTGYSCTARALHAMRRAFEHHAPCASHAPRMHALGAVGLRGAAGARCLDERAMRTLLLGAPARARRAVAVGKS